VVKIKYLISCAGTVGIFPIGSVRELPEAKGLYLVSMGMAELVKETKETPKDEVSNNIATSSRADKFNRGKRPSKN